MRRLVIVTLAALALAVSAPAVPAEDPVVQELTLVVDGSPASGIVAEPAGAVKAVVVFGHGYGHTTDSWTHHVRDAAAHGMAAAAMDYSPFFDLDRGAAESLAAAEHLAARHPGVPVIAFGVSMGGATTGMAVADGGDLFDWWFNVEGVTNLVETWAEAKAIGHPVAGYVEEDTGGTPAEAPDAYRARSVATRAHELTHLDGVFTVHALNDGLVPHNQAREMQAALAAAGVSQTFTTVVRGSCDEQGTTGTGALLGAVTPAHNPACLAGHATETSTTHPVMRTALDALYALADGSPPAPGEFVVDAPDA